MNKYNTSLIAADNQYGTNILDGASCRNMIQNTDTYNSSYSSLGVISITKLLICIL